MSDTAVAVFLIVVGIIAIIVGALIGAAALPFIGVVAVGVGAWIGLWQ